MGCVSVRLNHAGCSLPYQITVTSGSLLGALLGFSRCGEGVEASARAFKPRDSQPLQKTRLGEQLRSFQGPHKMRTVGARMCVGSLLIMSLKFPFADLPSRRHWMLDY
jgi:hypothetical protein